jgi:hypothetical protein
MRFRVMARVVATDGNEKTIKADSFEHSEEEEARRYYAEVVKRMRGSHAYDFQQAFLEREISDGTWERLDQLTKEQIR